MKKIELLMSSEDIDRVLTRITHQILEQAGSLDNLGIIGMQTRGVSLAKTIQTKIKEYSGVTVPMGVLDTALYRDDYRYSLKQPTVKVTDIPYDINQKEIILVDDVLYTGRTTRAALDAIMDIGRPQSVRFVALADRGRRELPIRADFVGKKLTTGENQELSLKVAEIDGEESSLWLVEKSED